MNSELDNPLSLDSRRVLRKEIRNTGAALKGMKNSPTPSSVRRFAFLVLPEPALPPLYPIQTSTVEAFRVHLDSL